ncbi:porin [Roseisalinus antarcticus]|uniref:Porin domain-containing protein n=1 Tax=Roseisalinus antarcticus TaxID=254357 RepID=A0A1Y5SKV8_9RHOB|nr:porin [Roseisalinus antarcticus]SLN42760.1 hypothetical protein ROA7023_01726 [Roseisalinus antarcticus]
MKSILLASASIVGLTIAGAASAEVGFAGDATVGYNDTDGFDTDAQGFYFSSNVAVTLSTTTDNGLTAAATFDFDVLDVEEDGDTDGLGLDLSSGGFLLSLTSEGASMFFGDTAFAAQTYYAGAGDLEADGFSEADGEIVLRGEAMFGSFTGGFSYVVADVDGNLVGDDAGVDSDFDQLSVGAVGTFGNFTVGMAYQAESDAVAGGSYDPSANGDFTMDEIFAIFGSTTVGAADISIAYASNQTMDTSSTGVAIAYPFGPVVLGAAFGSNPDGIDTYEVSVGYANGPVTVDVVYADNVDGTDEEVTLDATYDVGSGVTIMAGMNDGDGTAETDYYIGGTLALSDNVSLLASYAVDDDQSEEDAIGAPELQEGTTVEMSFTF